MEVKQLIIASPVLSSDTAADILRRSIARVELEKMSRLAENEIQGRKEFDKSRKEQDFGIAVKEFLGVMNILRKTVRKVVGTAKSGGYSRASLRYTVNKVDELIHDLQACKDYLKALE
jgi:hypothetical protein